jgi:hypothetical protein
MTPGGPSGGCGRVAQEVESGKNDENVEEPVLAGSRSEEADQSDGEFNHNLTIDYPVRQANGHWNLHWVIFSKNGGLEDVFGPVDVDPAKGMNRFIWQWGPDEHDAVVMSSNLAQVLRNCVNPDSAMLMFRTAMYCSRYNSAFPTINRETAKDYLVTEADGTHFVAQLDVRFALFRDEKGCHAVLFSLIAGTDIPVDLTVAIEACREGSMHVTPGLAAVPWNRYLNLHGGRSRYWIDSLVDRDKPGLVATNSRETGDNGVVLRALDIRVGTYRERGHIDYILLKDDQTALKLVEKATRRAIELVKHGQPIGINTNQANVYTIEIPSGPDHLIMLDKIIDWEDVLEAVHSDTPDNIASARWGIGERVLGMNNFSRHRIAYRLPWKFAGPLTMDPFASSRTSKLPILTFMNPEKRPIAPMEECLARARADWGHDADKMLALATVIQWFHNAGTQGKDKSYSKQICEPHSPQLPISSA